ncbi:LOW QUALITY PROTEIN: hypothetical protein QC762_0029370 [Podospora pseudocomata]|uniref:STAS domain-containing protein n=1 Tax=Podospora pseudocomata TaxID=2093779 RepID=A0ABR0GS34_9PEZI|nr:LOW QUALITY PROTEIN: hypothetical protein QC762_0029370 [Podospora pseudocomata]
MSMTQEKTAHFNTDQTQTFVEESPRVDDFFEISTFWPASARYLVSLFRFSWIGYLQSLQWLAGDLVAGITIGAAVVLPQGMAYARLANLDVQFGLYSSFMGVLAYWFFATSRTSPSPVAVAPCHCICSALLAGAVVVSIGLIRCGWIVDIISLTSLSAFMTGSAICIAVGQVPSLMGLSGFSTRDPTYLCVHQHTQTPETQRVWMPPWGCRHLLCFTLSGSLHVDWDTLPKKHQKLLPSSFLTLRVVFVIVLYTLISYLVNRSLPRGTARFKILFDVPRGFQNAAVPVINTSIVSNLMGYLPATVVVLLIEHIAISKSFGRVNNYRINPSQEMVAIGITNMLGPFLGGYAATGSFSRTAIKSKAGVRTPFAGVITAFCGSLPAIYALPAVFYYIPNASLSAFWLVSPFEVLIFLSVCSSPSFRALENGIYTTVLLSAAIFSSDFEIERPVLGRVKVQSMLGNRVIGNDRQQPVPGYGTFTGSQEAPTRNIFLPITHADGSNPEIELDNPYPWHLHLPVRRGVQLPGTREQPGALGGTHFAHTGGRTCRISTGLAIGLERFPARQEGHEGGGCGRGGRGGSWGWTLPTLKAVILDFSSVNHVDITSVQQLIDVRNQLDRYASPDIVDWHIACINNRWAKRALAAAGVWVPGLLCRRAAQEVEEHLFCGGDWGSHSGLRRPEVEVNEKEIARSRRQTAADVEVGNKQQKQQQHHHRGPNDPKKVGTGGSESVPRKPTVTFEHAVLSFAPEEDVAGAGATVGGRWWRRAWDQSAAVS